jgi:hypothetical protein
VRPGFATARSHLLRPAFLIKIFGEECIEQNENCQAGLKAIAGLSGVRSSRSDEVADFDKFEMRQKLPCRTELQASAFLVVSFSIIRTPKYTAEISMTKSGTNSGDG